MENQREKTMENVIEQGEERVWGSGCFSELGTWTLEGHRVLHGERCGFSLTIVQKILL